ncbi:MAG: carbohydrate ABC transporter permease [Chloroflexi bacterium]|nr:MAG: carbohydrate ABC transporter permease [Chloroflexota bacterium]
MNTNDTNSEKANFIDHLARRMTWPRFFFALGLIVFWTTIIFPFYWMVSSSFKTGEQMAGRAPVFVPTELRWDAYLELFDPSPEYTRYLWNHVWYRLLGGYNIQFDAPRERFQDFGVNVINSLFVAVPTALIAVILSMLGAYAVARLNFRGKDFLLNSILIIYLFPGILLIIPLFAMLSQLSQYVGVEVQDNLPVLIFTYLAQTLPVALYMLANYFRTIPDEIEQAALIDGCTRLGVIWRVTMPLAVPALVSVAIYTFMIAWNEFLYALVFLNDRFMFTMPIKINAIFNDPSPRMEVVMAASTVMSLPVMVLFLALERFLAEGLSAGGVKG